MKTSAAIDHGVGAVEQFKSMQPISLHRQTRIPMKRQNDRIMASLAAVVLAGVVLAAPRPATAQYTFTMLDAPGAASTDLTGSAGQRLAGDFADAEGNMHGWLATGGEFQQFDVP